jgi:hypothetical protein
MGHDYDSRAPAAGKGRGRGFRHRNSFKGRGNDPNNPKRAGTKPLEMKFAPHGQGKYETYATVKEQLVQHIQNKFTSGAYDVATSLKKMVIVDVDAEKPQKNGQRRARDWASRSRHRLY